VSELIINIIFIFLNRVNMSIWVCTLAAEESDYEEVVQSVSHGPLGEVFCLRCHSYGVCRLPDCSGIRSLGVSV
jgi:hypothetical protein